MREHLTAADIANEVRMTRSLHRGVFVIVEGDTDARVYGRFIDSDHCRIIPANGKDNAIESLAILDRDHFRGVFAIVDSDFWQLDGIAPPADNVFVTDTHDLETMIVRSDALDAMLAEFARPVKADTVRKLLLDITMPVGYFRWLSTPGQDDLCISFRDMKRERFVIKRNGTLSVDIRRMVSEALEQSHSVDVDRNVIISRLKALMSGKKHDPWHVCRGHDMIYMLHLSLHEVYGNNSGRRGELCGD